MRNHVWIINTQAISTFTLAFFLLSSLYAAHANPTSVARQDIAQVLANRALARQHKDLVNYMNTFSPSWQVENVNGKIVDHKTFLASMTKNFATGVPQSTGSIHSTITDLKLHGKAAYVSVTTTFEYPVYEGSTGPVYTYKRTKAQELWLKSPSGWVEEFERHYSDDVTSSRKPISM